LAISTELKWPRGNRKKVVFFTAAELEEQADTHASEAEQLPEGEARQNALRNAEQLSAFVKRAFTPQQTPKSKQ
jgi:hypothetical protein